MKKLFAAALALIMALGLAACGKAPAAAPAEGGISTVKAGVLTVVTAPDFAPYEFYSLDEIVVRGSQRNKGTAEARQVAMYLIRKLTNLSLPDIGMEFAKDHTTVLHSINKVQTELNNGNITMQNNIRDITANINSLL